MHLPLSLENEVPYYSTLLDIRKFLEQNIGVFPIHSCQHSTRMLKQILDLKQVAGYYLPLNKWHAWSYDLNLKLYIDLTMDQFSEEHDKIMILPKENLFLKSDLAATSNNLMTPENQFNPNINYLVKKFHKYSKY